MAVNAQVNIGIKTDSAEKNLKDLNKEMENVNETTKEASESVDLFTQSLKYNEEGMLEVSASISAMEDKLYELSLAGQQNTEEFKNLVTSAGQFKSAVQSVDLQVDSAAMTMNQKLGGALNGIAGGFALAQGVMGAFGAESEDVEKALLKVQSAMAILQGIQSIKESLPAIKGLGQSIKALAPAILGQAAATGTATTAQKVLNAVMNANPIFLIITGITALVGAFMLFGDSAEDAEKAQEKVNAQFERSITLLEVYGETISNLQNLTDRVTQQRILNLKKQGATEEQIFAASQAGLQDQIDLQKQLYDESARRAREASRNTKLTFEQFEQIQNKADEASKKLSELKFQYEINILEREVEAAQKAEEDKKKAAEKYAADRKAILEKIRQAEQDYHDTFLSDQDREIAIVNRKFKELIDEAKKYKINTSEVELARLNEINEINVKYAQEEEERLKQKAEKQKEIHDNNIRFTNETLLLEKQLAMQSELNLATSEEEKIKIRKKYNQELIDLQINQLEDERDILLSNTELTEAERLKIIADTNLKIAQLNEKSIENSKEDFKTLDDLVSEFRKNWSEDWVATFQEVVSQITSMVSEVTGALSQIFQESTDRRLYQNQLWYDDELEKNNALLANRTITQEQYDDKVAELEQERAEREKQILRKQFEREKKLNIVNAVMSTASGVAEAIPNPFLMAFAALMGATQIGIIASQQFRAARGGVVPGQPSNVDSVNALLAPGEMVINSNSSSMFPELLSAINQMGGGVSLVPDTPTSGVSNSRNPVYNENKMEYVRAVVVESEMTDRQKRVSRIERAAKFS